MRNLQKIQIQVRRGGAYNLKLSLGIEEDNENEKKNTLSLKPYSIETCYGYWVPNKYREILDKNIYSKQNTIEEKLKNILNLMEQKSIESMMKNYDTYIAEVRKILRDYSIEYTIDRDTKKSLMKKYENFLKRILAKLKDIKKVERLSCSLVSTVMPEIWEDEIASQDFMESFYEYIASATLSDRNPLVIASIKEQLGLEMHDDDEDIKDKFYKYFNENSWDDDCWKAPKFY